LVELTPSYSRTVSSAEIADFAALKCSSKDLALSMLGRGSKGDERRGDKSRQQVDQGREGRIAEVLDDVEEEDRGVGHRVGDVLLSRSFLTCVKVGEALYSVSALLRIVCCALVSVQLYCALCVVVSC
jgi:hypothetical protein